MDSDKKYRILQVHNYYQIPGGEDAVVANEKQLLEEHGHKVFQYTRNNNELKHLSVFQKLLLPFATLFNIKTYRDIRHIIKKQDIDIVHVHNTLSLISPAVYYAAISVNTPVVQTIHNFRLLCPDATFYRDGHICEDCIAHGFRCAIHHGCYRESKLQTLACVINLCLHRKLGIYRKLNYICLTEFNKKKLLEFKQVREKNIYIKPNFVEKTRDRIIPYKERPDQYIFVGRLEKLKGIDVLLRAWDLLGESAPKLIICGTGPMENWCREFIKHNKLKRVELKGFVENKETRRLISYSRALILPTQCYEGFPMTIAEAYSVGTPVIGSDIGNVDSIVEEGKTGWKFRPDSPGSLLSAINRCMETRELANDEFYKKYDSHTNYDLLQKIYAFVYRGK